MLHCKQIFSDSLLFVVLRLGVPFAFLISSVFSLCFRPEGETYQRFRAQYILFTVYISKWGVLSPSADFLLIFGVIGTSLGIIVACSGCWYHSCWYWCVQVWCTLMLVLVWLCFVYVSDVAKYLVIAMLLLITFMQHYSPLPSRLTALLWCVILNEWLYLLIGHFWISSIVVCFQCCLLVTWPMPRRTAAISLCRFCVRSSILLPEWLPVPTSLSWTGTHHGYHCRLVGHLQLFLLFC